jgi:hypothetical protein
MINFGKFVDEFSTDLILRQKVSILTSDHYFGIDFIEVLYCNRIIGQKIDSLKLNVPSKKLY